MDWKVLVRNHLRFTLGMLIFSEFIVKQLNIRNKDTVLENFRRTQTDLEHILADIEKST